jgi:hypothetical protein
MIKGFTEHNGAGSWLSRTKESLRLKYRRYMEDREEFLSTRTTDRVVREFEWGLDWTAAWPSAEPGLSGDPADYLKVLSDRAVRNSRTFYGYEKPSDFRFVDNHLTFTSAAPSPHPVNNVVHAQLFPASRPRGRAVLVLPHWNSRMHQHVSLCRALAALGVSALRLSLPYHDLRMPPELQRADYAVSSNVARTVEATRQAVIDARSCLDWLETQEYDRFGIAGTSLGSCYAFLTSAHDGRLRANVYNLFSLYFADVVWTGLTTRHIREGLEGRITLEQLRAAWMSITPLSFIDLYSTHPDKRSLFIYGTCDTTFLPRFSEAMIEQARTRGIPHKVVVLPCGHYTLGESPFKFIDGYQICSFLLRNL